MADREQALAVIVVRADQPDPVKADPDPVYGKSLAHTWQWLNANADGGGQADDGEPWIDFGIQAMQQKWKATHADQQQQLNAPTQDAAVLLPQYVDQFCQTAPVSAPPPDPTVFLHGAADDVADVQVVFR